MTALEIANQLTENKKEVSSLKKEINRHIFKMKEVEQADGDERPPRWLLRRNYPVTYPATIVVTQHNLASSTPTPYFAQRSEKYTLPGLPTLDPASPSTTSVSPLAGHPAPQGQSSYNPPGPPLASTSTQLGYSNSPSFEEEILRALAASNEPLQPLDIAKKVGKKSARDVNPTLYQLEREGKVQREPTGATKKLWKIVISPPSNTSATTPPQPPHGASSVPPPSIGTSNDLFRKTELQGGDILFKKVNAVESNEPITVTPVSETRPDPQVNAPVQLSVEESTAQPSQSAQPAQSSPHQSSHGGVSRPIQIEVDDRERQQPIEPVAPPDAVNFKDRGKSLEKDDKNSGAKFKVMVAKNESMAAEINAANNQITEESPSRSSTDPSPSSQNTSVFDSTASSLSSLSLEPASTDSNLTSSTCTGTTDDRTPSRGASAEVGSGEDSKKKKKKRKKKLAIQFPSDKK